MTTLVKYEAVPTPSPKPIGSNEAKDIPTARQRNGANVGFLAFDLLELRGRDVMVEPWVDRRKRLENSARAA